MYSVETIGALDSAPVGFYETLNAVFELIGVIVGVVWIISLVVGIFMLICMWRCYTKMGEPGWAAVIPLYNTWVLCKHTWGHGAMMFTWLIPVAGGVLIMATFFKLFEKFGKPTLFNVLGMFFTPIALAICAFDDSEFAG